MPHFRIVTAEPILSFTGTLEEAKAYVEKYAPMKRGWTAEWYQGGLVWYYRRMNSKGHVQDRLTIALEAIPVPMKRSIAKRMPRQPVKREAPRDLDWGSVVRDGELSADV